MSCGIKYEKIPNNLISHADFKDGFTVTSHEKFNKLLNQNHKTNLPDSKVILSSPRQQIISVLTPSFLFGKLGDAIPSSKTKPCSGSTK